MLCSTGNTEAYGVIQGYMGIHMDLQGFGTGLGLPTNRKHNGE